MTIIDQGHAGAQANPRTELCPRWCERTNDPDHVGPAADDLVHRRNVGVLGVGAYGWTDTDGTEWRTVYLPAELGGQDLSGAEAQQVAWGLLNAAGLLYGRPLPRGRRVGGAA